MDMRSVMSVAIGALAFLLHAGACVAVQPVVLTADQDAVVLSPGTRYLVDSSGLASASEQFPRIESDDFQPLPNGSATFGFVDGTYWFHTRLINADTRASRRILLLGYVLLDEVDVHLRHADGTVVHQASGDRRTFSERALRYRAPNFFIDLEAGEQADLLVRVRSESSMQVPLVLYSQSGFFELTRDSQFGFGLYYGMLLALLLYNLILFISLRDINYLYYSLYVAGFGLVQLCLNGLA